MNNEENKFDFNFKQENNGMAVLNDALQAQKSMIVTDNAPESMQITYSPEIKSKLFQKAPYLRFLESRGRVDDNFDSTFAAFYLEDNQSYASFIAEYSDIPEAVASSYTEKMRKMSVLIEPIEVSLMAQLGNNVINILQREIDKGFINIANKTDSSLIKWNSTDKSSSVGFPGIMDDIDDASSSDQHIIDAGGESITESVIDDLLHDIIENGSSPDVLITDFKVAKQLKALVAPYMRYENVMDIGLGHRVISYQSPSGISIPILVDSNMPTSDDKSYLLAIDSSTIDVKRLLAPTVLNNLPTNKLGTRDAVVSMLTTQCIAVFQNGYIKNIGDEVTP